MPWRGDLSLIAAPSGRLPGWLRPATVRLRSNGDGSPALGWSVLALVFVDELLVMAALGVWGADAGGWPLSVGARPGRGVVWFFFASPKARYGGPVARPVAKVLVIGAAVVGLAAAGHTVWAVALASFSVVVNGVALHPDIRELPTATTAAGSDEGPMRAPDEARGSRPAVPGQALARLSQSANGGECKSSGAAGALLRTMGGSDVRTLHHDQR